MKKYYVNYYSNFANTYDLRYTEGDEQPKDGYERITLKEAQRLARSESDRRKSDPNFSHFASTIIIPMNADEDDQYDIRCRYGWEIVDRVAVRK